MTWSDDDWSDADEEAARAREEAARASAHAAQVSALLEAIRAGRCPACGADRFFGAIVERGLQGRCASCDHRANVSDLGGEQSLSPGSPPWPGFLEGALRPPPARPFVARAPLPLTVPSLTECAVFGFAGEVGRPKTRVRFVAGFDGLEVEDLGTVGGLRVDGREVRHKALAAEGNLLQVGTLLLAVSATAGRWTVSPTPTGRELPLPSPVRGVAGGDTWRRIAVSMGAPRTLGRSDRAELALPSVAGAPTRCLVRLSARPDGCRIGDLEPDPLALSDAASIQVDGAPTSVTTLPAGRRVVIGRVRYEVQAGEAGGFVLQALESEALSDAPRVPSAPISRLAPGTVIVVGRGQSLTFGRTATHCDVPLHAMEASRTHFRVTVEPGGEALIMDVASRGGTSVNGCRVDRADLRVGDRIEVGVTHLVVSNGPDVRLTVVAPRRTA